MTINKEKFFENFLERYNELARKDDKAFDKYTKAEEEGNTEKMRKLDRRMDIYCSKMDGMCEVLHMIGYTVQWQVDKFVIVHR